MTNLTQKYALLSPFELKNELARVALSREDHMMLNAGRGNPNFLATAPRAAFFCLGEFAVQESALSYSYLGSGVGGQARVEGMAARFELFLISSKGRDGAEFLSRAVSYVRDQMGLNADEVIHEWVEGILGCFYPGPPRMLKHAENIVASYVLQEMGGRNNTVGAIDLFATEGGTAAMAYIFHTLFVNNILKKGDRIALGEPIFTPYIEIPALEEYGLEVVKISADPKHDWQYPAAELDKLLDPKIKVFFCVNPSNPPSVKMNDASLAHIENLVRQVRKDLIILTDDVYGTFADRFQSLFTICPFNTILVYSFSKYFGATGWRLGVIAAQSHNVVDELLSAQSEEAHSLEERRYESLTSTPSKMRFIDRLVADSRSIALNHTAGLSTPQQVQMTLFGLSALMDREDAYRKTVKAIVRHRFHTLYEEVGFVPDADANGVDYYMLIDLVQLAHQSYGEAFASWMEKEISIVDFLFQIAQEFGVVLLPGKGFGTSDLFARVSLANLNEYQYRAIGRCIRQKLDAYFKIYRSSNA